MGSSSEVTVELPTNIVRKFASVSTEANVTKVSHASTSTDVRCRNVGNLVTGLIYAVCDCKRMETIVTILKAATVQSNSYQSDNLNSHCFLS